MIDRDVFLAAAKAIRTHNFDAIDEDTGRIDVTVDGAHRSVDVAEMLVWLVAEADATRATLEKCIDVLEAMDRCYATRLGVQESAVLDEACLVVAQAKGE